VGISGDDNVPIKALFSEQEVAQRAADEIGLLALIAEVAGCVL
jgi:hypothetical protein